MHHGLPILTHLSFNNRSKNSVCNKGIDLRPCVRYDRLDHLNPLKLVPFQSIEFRDSIQFVSFLTYQVTSSTIFERYNQHIGDQASAVNACLLSSTPMFRNRVARLILMRRTHKCLKSTNLISALCIRQHTSSDIRSPSEIRLHK